MRRVRPTVSIAVVLAAGAVATVPASAEASPLKRCGSIELRRPAGVSPKRISGTLTARGLTCRAARITIRSVARRYRQPTSFELRGYVLDCEGDLGYLSCAGVRRAGPAGDGPTLGFTFRPRRR